MSTPLARRHPLQPGCWTIFCAHGRAYEYFAETVRPGQEHNFAATRCNTLAAFKLGHCRGPTVAMGLLADRGPENAAGAQRPSGSYFLLTNDESPFGRATALKAPAPCAQSAA